MFIFLINFEMNNLFYSFDDRKQIFLMNFSTSYGEALIGLRTYPSQDMNNKSVLKINN